MWENSVRNSRVARPGLEPFSLNSQTFVLSFTAIEHYTWCLPMHSKERKKKKGTENEISLINTEEAQMGWTGEGVPCHRLCQLQVPDVLCHRGPCTRHLSPQHWLENISCLANISGDRWGWKTSWTETEVHAQVHWEFMGKPTWKAGRRNGKPIRRRFSSARLLLARCVNLSLFLNLQSLSFFIYIKNSNTDKST